MVTMWTFDGYGSGNNPLFMGDIWGDWRTEVVMISQAQDSLTIFTTDIETTNRIYTMAHNPEYRDAMTIMGYYEMPLVDYYLGDGMSTPPVPNIVYVGGGGSTGIVSGAVYQLVNQYSGKALDDDSRTTNGSPAIQWTAGTGNQQKWTITDVGGGYYKLICQKSGKALDNNSSTTDGTTVVQKTDNGGTPQKWQLIKQ